MKRVRPRWLVEEKVNGRWITIHRQDSRREAREASLEMKAEGYDVRVRKEEPMFAIINHGVWA